MKLHKKQTCFLLGIFLVVGITFYGIFYHNYSSQHHPINDVTPNIKYNTLSKQANRALHIDSYTVKNKKQIYFDSLLERYSYYDVGDKNFVNSYVGSHGIVSFNDPIVSVYAKNKSFVHDVAVSTGFKNSNFALNQTKLINYANQVRTVGSKRLAVNEQYYKHIFPQSLYKVLCLKSYKSDEVMIAESPDSDMDVHVVITRVYTSDNFAHSEVYKYSRSDDGYIGGQYMNYAYNHDIAAVFQKRKHFPHWTYNNGQRLRVHAKPFDNTQLFFGKNISAPDFYKNVKGNTLYSNGNSYFLQYMYNNALHKENYHLIDVYHRGWHLNPIMFNDFVKQPFNYKNQDCPFNLANGEPYSFNYLQSSTPIWKRFKPFSKKMLNFVESQNYNMPCNYDNDHYYYRTIEGTLLPDDNIRYINKNVHPMIMGDIHGTKKMPKQTEIPHIHSDDAQRYHNLLDLDYAQQYRHDYKLASQKLNYTCSDGGLEPLWMIGLANDKQIGTYQPGEIVRYNDKLSTKPISKYYIVQHGKHYYLPTYNIHGVTCFKATVVFKNKTRYFVRAQDAYMLMGDKIHHQ